MWTLLAAQAAALALVLLLALLARLLELLLAPRRRRRKSPPTPDHCRRHRPLELLCRMAGELSPLAVSLHVATTSSSRDRPFHAGVER
jgi:hypothetical protein